MSEIAEKVEEIKSSIPAEVVLVAATKGRDETEMLEAIDAGIEIVGENYVQEAVGKYEKIGDRARWHMIGHLQRNKARDAIKIFECIQSVDSLRLAKEINKQCNKADTTIPALVEINIAGEESKYGISPEDLIDMLRQMAELPNFRIEGIMTMEPYSDDPEDARPYFRRMKQLFERAKAEGIPGVNMKILSMGMSNSYQVAVEEGSNMIRLGTKLFGPRSY